MDENKVVARETPEVPEERKSLVADLCKQVDEAESGFWKPMFDRMRENMKFAKGWQWGQTSWDDKDDRYTANLVHRHIRQRVAALYAKNPRIVANAKEKMLFTVWDEDQQKIDAARMLMGEAAGLGGAMGMPVLANAAALLQDYEQGMAAKRMQTKVARTLQLVFAHVMQEQSTAFKSHIKQLIVRVLTCGVGYCKIGFQRAMERSPELENRLFDVQERLSRMEAIAADIADGEVYDNQPEMEELRLMAQDLGEQFDVLVREGLVFEFPKSTAIIIDPQVSFLKNFQNADWLAHKFIFTPKKVQEVYGVDIGSNFEGHNADGKRDKRKKEPFAVVYEMQHKAAGLVYHLCKGYPDFLKEPAAPDLKFEQFWNVFPLSFNDIEDEDDIFPPSDVQLMRSMQQEYNRAREGIREHRQGNRPAWISADGIFDENDQAKLATHETHELITLKGVRPGTDVKTVLQPKPQNAIDAAVYDTEFIFADTQRVVGSQAADFGGTSGATATEASIAEQTRVSTVSSNIDDLDDFLTAIARASGQVLLMEMSEQTVKKIVGPGAVWPSMSRQELAEEIYLEIQAGSSGRPNRSQDLANLERIAPFLIQIPGITPRWLAEEFLRRLDDGLDLTDAFDDAIQSVVAMNQAKQPATGDPMTDPNQQGGQGGQNAPQPDRAQPGPQAGMPAGGPV